MLLAVTKNVLRPRETFIEGEVITASFQRNWSLAKDNNRNTVSVTSRCIIASDVIISSWKASLPEKSCFGDIRFNRFCSLACITQDGHGTRRPGNPRVPNRNERNAGRVDRSLPEDVAATRELRNKLVAKLGRKGLNTFNSYLKNVIELARCRTTYDFLNRCNALSILPPQYRLSNFQARNTPYIRRLLERFSCQLMRAELRYSQKRCFQIERLLTGKTDALKELHDEETFAEIISLVERIQARRFDEFLKSRNDAYQSLIGEYGISPEEASEAEAAVERNEEARRQRRAEADQQPQQSTDSNVVAGSSNEPRVFARGQRRRNSGRTKPITNDD